MNENIKWIAAAVGVVGLAIGAVVYRDSWWRDELPPAAEEPKLAVAPEPVAPPPPEPAIKHPLPEPEVKEPLPRLDESDEPAKNALESLIGKESIERFILTKDLVRHVVVTIDNLTNEEVAERVRPIRPIPGKFAVSGPEEAPVLDPANYSRYEPLVQMVGATDTQALIAAYTRYYPLFQEAYVSLGHPPQYFNDRVIVVIDHLLETPDVQGPIALTQPRVQFEFADPKLESLSAGQKALLRMGSANAKVIKDKLRELRSAIVAQRPAPESQPGPQPAPQPAP
jgi:hypothetical protein